MANRKNTRRSNTRNRQRSMRQRSMRQRRRHGGAAVSLGMAAGLDAAYKPLEGTSLQQGQQFAELTKQFHGGAADYPSALSGTPLIDGSMAAAARTATLDKAMGEIKGMSDMAGGRRRGKRSTRSSRRKASRSAHRKGRKSSRKASRSAHRKAGRKASRSARRKAGRKSYRQRRRQGGGALAMNPADYSKSGDFMIGVNPQAAGLHKEWADVASTGGGDYMAPAIQQTYRSDGEHA